MPVQLQENVKNYISARWEYYVNTLPERLLMVLTTGSIGGDEMRNILESL